MATLYIRVTCNNTVSAATYNRWSHYQGGAPLLSTMVRLASYYPSISVNGTYNATVGGSHGLKRIQNTSTSTWNGSGTSGMGLGIGGDWGMIITDGSNAAAGSYIEYTINITPVWNISTGIVLQANTWNALLALAGGSLNDGQYVSVGSQCKKLAAGSIKMFSPGSYSGDPSASSFGLGLTTDTILASKINLDDQVASRSFYISL